jgi:hypothetical protein
MPVGNPAIRDPDGADGACNRSEGGISAETSMDVEGHNNSGAPILILAESLTGLEKNIHVKISLEGNVHHEVKMWEGIVFDFPKQGFPSIVMPSLQLCFGFSMRTRAEKR